MSPSGDHHHIRLLGDLKAALTLAWPGSAIILTIDEFAAALGNTAEGAYGPPPHSWPRRVLASGYALRRRS